MMEVVWPLEDKAVDWDAADLTYGQMYVYPRIRNGQMCNFPKVAHVIGILHEGMFSSLSTLILQ